MHASAYLHSAALDLKSSSAAAVNWTTRECPVENVIFIRRNLWLMAVGKACRSI